MDVFTFIHEHLPHHHAADSNGEKPVDAAGDPLPYPGYDHHGEKQIVGELHLHSQVQLAAVEEYERAHSARKAVLDKLHFLRRSEPLPGYDAMSVKQILATAKGADLDTLDHIWFYETKFGQRPAVLDVVIPLEHTRRDEQAPEAGPRVQARSALTPPRANVVGRGGCIASTTWPRLAYATEGYGCIGFSVPLDYYGQDIYPDGPASAYRTYDQQAELYQQYLDGTGAPADPPGTSSHELGTAVDVATPEMRSIVDSIGRQFGLRQDPRADRVVARGLLRRGVKLAHSS